MQDTWFIIEHCAHVLFFMPSSSLALSIELIQKPSITPKDENCMDTIVQLLTPLGFKAHFIESGEGSQSVRNVWLIKPSTHAQKTGTCFVFAGHTDVVPTGPLEKWHSPPFAPEIRDGFLYGRGSADMKSSIAAFAIAAQKLVQKQPDHRMDIALLLTSDEEGPAIHGTTKVVDWLKQENIHVAYTLVGEPTSANVLGDTIKHGRRGSLTGKLRIIGKQGHVAYPQLANNPIHCALPLLLELTQTRWDEGSADFPPTSLQISNIHGGTGAGNVIPEDVVVDFNCRFSNLQTAEGLQEKIEAICRKYHPQYVMDWTVGARVFLSEKKDFAHTLAQAVRKHTHVEAEFSTTGGTSDARFMATICREVLEFGPVNASIHQINEHILAEDIAKLEAIYLDVLEQITV